MFNLTCKSNLMVLGLAFVATATVQAAQFVPIYRDSRNNLLWGKALVGEYSNGCLGEKNNYDSSKCTFETESDGSRQVKVDDSNAAKACRKLGARLPTKTEIESLIRNFDHEEKDHGPRLTYEGRRDMQTTFGDMASSFWSSSVRSGYPDVASGFVEFNDIAGLYRHFDRPVRCVSDR